MSIVSPVRLGSKFGEGRSIMTDRSHPQLPGRAVTSAMLHAPTLKPSVGNKSNEISLLASLPSAGVISKIEVRYATFRVALREWLRRGSTSR